MQLQVPEAAALVVVGMGALMAEVEGSAGEVKEAVASVGLTVVAQETRSAGRSPTWAVGGGPVAMVVMRVEEVKEAG